jgi:hypothetical protein
MIYAGKSDYARENGKRWDLQIIPGMYAQESMRERILSEGTHIYRWEDWLHTRISRRAITSVRSTKRSGNPKLSA